MSSPKEISTQSNSLFHPEDFISSSTWAAARELEEKNELLTKELAIAMHELDMQSAHAKHWYGHEAKCLMTKYKKDYPD